MRKRKKRRRLLPEIGDAPQGDDMTMLPMEFKEGGQPMQTLTVEAKKENLEQLTAFVDAYLEAHDCPMKTQMQIDLCLEEAFVNIASYAYGDESGEAELQISETDNGVMLTLLDSGVPYDPLTKEDPDMTLSADERQVGGLGIFLVKKLMDAVYYRWEQGKNILTMKKEW